MTVAVEHILVPELERAAEIVVDRWGIPHIYAESERDAFFAQGFNAARDRLWQIDLWRKRGLGLLAGDLGKAYVKRDRAARLLLYRGDLDAEWACYGENAKANTSAFTAGINAYIELVEREPARLPIEFRELGTKPSRWLPEDVVRCRAHARVRNLDSEITRNNIAVDFGMDADRLHKGLQPAWRVEIPDGWLLEAVPAEVMRTYLLGCEPNAIGSATPAEALQNAGSNNWAIAPDRTTTGRAILASDPHRVHDHPSLRYIAHLIAPGLNVIGAGEAAIPGVSLGHNEHLAFSLTIHPADQEDLYVYETHPEDPQLYRYDGDWERMRVVVEMVPVKNSEPVPVELRFTRHGPVLHSAPEARRAYALKSVWWEPGTAAYMASLGYLASQNFEQYRNALHGWGSPPTNHVVADIEGKIGWSAAAKIPVRRTWDGLLPVPGDGRHEWQGTMCASEILYSHSSASGWLGSANQMNLPADFDHATHRTGFEWADDSRFRRMQEMLDGGNSWSVSDTLALQTDVLSIPARRLCSLLDKVSGGADEARGMLRDWDHRVEATSAAAALFEIWFSNHLMPSIARILGPAGLAARLEVVDTALALDLLEQATDPGFGTDPCAVRDTLLTSTLADAWLEAVARMGSNPAAWSWGSLHHAFFQHPLSSLVSEGLAARLNVGPMPKGGSGLTINNNGYRRTDFRITSGVSWRMVVDVGDWDNSWTINSPGQSGDPSDPHYRDHFELWAKDQYVPLLFTRPAIETAAERKIRLSPPE